MLIRILFNYILGYVNISVEGYFIERFINMCLSKDILLWNLKRKKTSFLQANIGIAEFKKIKQVAKKTNCRVKIKAKKGLPFILHRYKKRKIFFILLFIILTSLIISSNFIWNIEIIGNENILTEELLQDLNGNGLTIGKFKKGINTKDIINAIRLNRDDIAWMGINIDGTNAIVEVVEASDKPDIVDENDYCNIISDKKAVITKTTVQNGTGLVSVGDVVQVGTILVGGYIDGKYTGTRYVHAEAEIEARVWYSKKEKMNLTTDIDEQTGEVESKYSISINNFTINFYKTLSKFEKYDTINEDKKLKLFSNFYLPITLTKTTNYNKETTTVTYTKAEAEAILTEKLQNELYKEIENTDKIVNTQVNVNKEEGAIEVEVIYEVLETIGTKEKISF